MKWWTTLLGFALGVLTVLFWPSRADQGDADSADGARSGKGGVVMGDSGPLARAGARPEDNQQGMEAEISKPIGDADLESWLEGRKGDSRSFAEALVIAGLLTGNPDLVRQGIETDPENGHLLFIGATLPAFSEAERLAMGKRLLAADPDNALAAFIAAAHSLEAGESDAALQMLKGSSARHKMDDYRLATQLLTEDALMAAGLSPDAARFRSVFELKLGYLSDLRSLAGSLKGMEGSMSAEEASELRSLKASMGQRLADQSRMGTILDHVSGIALEEATMSDLPDEAPSPYEGLTVGQARESIMAERQELRQVMEKVPDVQALLSDDPDLMRRYVDHVRLVGEMEALKWLAGAAESGK